MFQARDVHHLHNRVDDTLVSRGVVATMTVPPMTPVLPYDPNKAPPTPKLNLTRVTFSVVC